MVNTKYDYATAYILAKHGFIMERNKELLSFDDFKSLDLNTLNKYPFYVYALPGTYREGKLPINYRIDYVKNKYGKHILYFIGPSGSGKDFLLEAAKEVLGCDYIKEYTSRPQRPNEDIDSRYKFLNKSEFNSKNYIERRKYDVLDKAGNPDVWYYGTPVEEFKNFIDSDDNIRVASGSLESYMAIKSYIFAVSNEEINSLVNLIPIFIKPIDDNTHFEALYHREKQKLEMKRNYTELTRRWIKDKEDFSNEKLKNAGITETNIIINKYTECSKLLMQEIAQAYKSFLSITPSIVTDSNSDTIKDNSKEESKVIQNTVRKTFNWLEAKILLQNGYWVAPINSDHVLHYENGFIHLENGNIITSSDQKDCKWLHSEYNVIATVNDIDKDLYNKYHSLRSQFPSTYSVNIINYKECINKKSIVIDYNKIERILKEYFINIFKTQFK